MLLTNTTNLSSFTRPNSVTYTLPSPPYSSPHVQITLPPGSKWTSGLHWHETHTEYLQVLSGTALITLGRITKLYTSSDGVVTVPRYARHEWRRPDSAPEFHFGDLGEEEEGELIVREWTDPADGQKETFFRNLSSVIEDCVREGNGKPTEWWMVWKLWVVFWGLDNWPVFFSTVDIPVLGAWLERLALGGVLEWIVTHVVLWVAVLLGRVVGLRSVHEEYTPNREVKKNT